MNDRTIRSYSLPMSLVIRVNDLQTALLRNPELTGKLLAAPAPRSTVAIDKYGLLPDDYKEMQAFLGSTKTGYELMNFGVSNKATRHGTEQLIRKAQIRNRRLRGAQDRMNRVTINTSRVVEALILKGLASIDAATKIAGSKIGDASKVAR